MANFWTQISGTKLATLQERVTTTVPLPLSQSQATLKVISGNLPEGMQLKNNEIIGTPAEVARVTDYKFAIRATYDNQISDRTFIITVEGEDEPEWITDEGLLPIGPNNTFYVLDNTPIDYQLEVLDTDIEAGQELEFFIGSGDGTLPPGIQLTTDGRLVGVVDPILALEKASGSGQYDTAGYDGRSAPYDFGIKSSNGFDSFFYDTTIYDLSIPTQSPKKLNRYYEFTVSVSDGDTIARRTFTLYVVGDDFLRVDNTVMQVANGIFKADNTHIRTPIWLTPRNFGFRRANNYVTLFLDVLDPNSLSGVVTYTLQDFNDDGTVSTLPPGTTIDNTTGEVAGRVPYQPSINREYKFTVKASRYGPTTNAEFVTIKVYEDAQPGASSFKIFKNTDTESLVGNAINLFGQSYKVSSVDTTSQFYDVINIATPVSVFMFETTQVGGTSLKIRKLGRPVTEKLLNQNINFGAQEVSITAIDYNEKLYKAKESHTSKTFSADLFNTLWEEVTGNVASYNSWTTGTSYSKGDIIKHNNSQFEILTIAQPTIINVFAGLQADTTLSDPLTNILKKDLNFDIQTVSNIELEVAESTKTFTVTLLGDVNSEINFTTPSNLGRISSNYISTLLIEGTSSVAGAQLLYSIVDGSLPPGLSLGFDGSITGKVIQFGTSSQDGLTTFDSNTFTLDGNSTRIDRKFTFTVKAQDQFLYSAKEKEYFIVIEDPDNKSYSDLVFKPYLKKEQRNEFNNIISNPEIFLPESIYRPYDDFFGIQNTIKMLVYAGIETKSIDQYVAAITKNHKRKRFKIGDVKTAVAKTPGTNDIVYEVVYLEILDPQMPKQGRTRKSFRIDTKENITVDQSRSAQDSDSKISVSITGRSGTIESELTSGSLPLETRTARLNYGSTNRFKVELRNETLIEYIGRVSSILKDLTEPYKLPTVPDNPIKVDTDAIKVSEGKDQVRYITNLYHMRDNISKIGLTELNFLPLWMRTAQEGDVRELGFTPAVVLCYTKPGQSKIIRNNIKNVDFNWQQFDFDIDRYIIDNAVGNSNEQFLLFGNYQFNAN